MKRWSDPAINTKESICEQGPIYMIGPFNILKSKLNVEVI